MLFDIPINIKVANTNEQKAEQDVFDFLKAAMREYGTEYNIQNWEYFEFASEESCSSGCGNKHQ